MYILSTAIMHAPWDSKRVDWLKTICERVDNIDIVTDDNRDGIWATAKRAWKIAGNAKINFNDRGKNVVISTRSTHHIVMQDDMIPCIDWNSRLMEAINKYPEACISGFQPSQGLLSNRYHLNKIPIYNYKGNVWGGSFVLPLKHALAVSDWCDENAKDISDNLDDLKISRYCFSNNVKTFHMYPPMFEHVGYDTSLVGHENNIWRAGDGKFLNKKP